MLDGSHIKGLILVGRDVGSTRRDENFLDRSNILFIVTLVRNDCVLHGRFHDLILIKGFRVLGCYMADSTT